jgi:hypothetical protein
MAVAQNPLQYWYVCRQDRTWLAILDEEKYGSFVVAAETVKMCHFFCEFSFLNNYCGHNSM